MIAPERVEPLGTREFQPARSAQVEFEAAEAELLTPTVRRNLRRGLFWILGVTVVLAVGFVVMVLQRAGQGPTDVLDPDAATPQGARAAIEVLRGQGVEVLRTSSLADTIEAVAGREDAAILLRDETTLLSDEQYLELLGATDRLIVLAPGFTQLDLLAPGIEPAGALVTAPTILTAECELPIADRAQLIDVEGLGYRIVDAPPATGCFPGENADAYGYLETVTDGTRVAVVGPEGLLRNDSITRSGNAAFGLGLLGEEPLLVWYEPSAEDLRASDRVPTLQELTAPWVTPLAILVFLVVIAAGVWKGRRFGPVVVERLPVEVRANETMEGRARLYARGDARGHSATALRIGTIGRLADRTGLPRAAGATELVAALVGLTGRSREELERLLVTGVPGTDAELMELSDELRLLEAELAEATSLGPAS